MFPQSSMFSSNQAPYPAIMNTELDTETLLCTPHTPHVDNTLSEFNPEEAMSLILEMEKREMEELKKYIIPYPCTRGLNFAKLGVAKMPIYPRVLELRKNRPDAIFLDIACSTGAEVREVIRDGWPLSHVIATASHQGFWDKGHELFKTTPETFPVKFLAGDTFNDAHLSLTAPVPSGPPPPVASVNTLTELRGHISVIRASSLFHIFNEEKQFELCKRLAALLDPRPGSIIFGSHGGMPVKCQRQGLLSRVCCHSPESWTEMWEERIFKKGQVKVNAVLREMDTAAEELESVGPAREFYLLVWSVERL